MGKKENKQITTLQEQQQNLNETKAKNVLNNCKVFQELGP